MAEVFRFRVLIDYDEDVFRDIEILSDQTFEDLHHAIQKNFEFDGQQMASFYMSNENWDKGLEINLFDMSGDDQGTENHIMSDTRLDEMVESPNQKIIYVFDFLLMWCFYVELICTSEINPVSSYPMCVHRYGKAPDQYAKEISNQILPEDIGPIEKSIGSPDSDIFDGFDDFSQFIYEN